MLRRIFSRYRYFLFFTGCVYILTSFWILSRLENDLQGIQPRTTSFFTRIHDPFGSRLKRKEVVLNLDINSGIDAFHKGNNDRRLVETYNIHRCYQKSDAENADIVMEDVWDRVSVGYPKLVLSVTGWVDTIKVTGWSTKPLHVIVVPHSHQDPGWLQTSEGYFSSFTKKTLDIMVQRLESNPSWKFIWSEIIFLNWWWKGATSEQRTVIKSLLTNGQLELVTGGWVMPDESITHYSTLIDQLTEGHQWIQQTFNITVNTSWAIDPFGHSSTMPYILQRAGIQNMVIQRTHFAVKRMFAKEKTFEFYWKQAWGGHGSAIFCHMMPFLLYSIPHSCGPDRHVCCKFDFHKKNCFKGTHHVPTITVTDTNVATLANELWEQLQKKSEMYRRNVVLMPHGDDFRYNNDEEWDKQFTNLEKIMKYINDNKAMNTKIEFGTLADYFNAVSHDNLGATLDSRFPTLSGDFLTYSDRGDQYWSGIYGTRPFLKYLIRKLQAQLRQSESMFLFSRMEGHKMRGVYDKLETARRGLAVHLHHDAITGTSRKTVIQNYISKIKKTLKETEDIFKASLECILARSCPKNQNKEIPILIELNEKQETHSMEDRHHIFPNHRTTTVMITNMLGHERQEIIHFTVNTSRVIVTDSKHRPVRHQIGPVWNNGSAIDQYTYILSFEVKIDPYTIAPYFVDQSDDGNEDSVSKIEFYRHNEIFNRFKQKQSLFEIVYFDRNVIKLSNTFLTAVITSRDGSLKSVYHHSQGRVYRSDIHFVTYSTGRNSHPFSDKSGAYIFQPDGVAKDLKEEPVQVYVIRGPLFSQVKTVFPNVTLILTVFNNSGALGYGIRIETIADINSDAWDNRELVMRVETDIYDEDHSFCTDVNGFQLQRRKTRSKMTIQGNFHPVTTMTLTENDNSRFTLLTTSSHGVASLVSGWLEVVLDRRLVQDDWRGLNEKVVDNVPVKNTFFVLFEEKIHVKANGQASICLPSTLSDTLSEQLNNPLTVSPLRHSPVCSPTIQLAKGLPCGHHILNLRMLRQDTAMKQALVAVHHRGVDCTFQSIEQCSNQTLWSFDAIPSLEITDVKETSLTGTEEIRKIDPSENINIEPMEIKTYKIAFR